MSGLFVFGESPPAGGEETDGRIVPVREPFPVQPNGQGQNRRYFTV